MPLDILKTVLDRDGKFKSCQALNDKEEHLENDNLYELQRLRRTSYLFLFFFVFCINSVIYMAEPRTSRGRYQA
jgi:hypothetical protein